MKPKIPERMSVEIYDEKARKWVTGNQRWQTKYDLDQAYYLSLNLFVYSNDQDEIYSWYRWNREVESSEY